MSAERSWGHYYAGAGGVDYFLEHLAIHKEFVAEILSRKPATALEAGCGSSIMSVFLAMAGVRVTACDRDADVLRKAASIAAEWKAPVRYEAQDLLRLTLPGPFDVAFSQGVIEHMTDEQVRESSRQLLRLASAFVFSVPGRHYSHRDFGDERLLTEAQWRRVFDGVGHLTLTPYFYRRVKRNFMVRRPLMLMGVLTR